MKNAVRILALVGLVLGLTLTGFGANKPPQAPFEVKGRSKSVNVVDTAVKRAWRKHRITPALPCSDAVFVRRVYLDVIGTLPTPGEVRKELVEMAKDARA